MYMVGIQSVRARKTLVSYVEMVYWFKIHKLWHDQQNE